MKSKRMLLLSVLLALLAGVSVFRFLSAAENKARATANLVPVLVARADIPARSRLDKAMFIVVESPKDFIHADALTDPAAVQGAFTRERLVAGEQVLASRLVQAGEVEGGLAYLISPGYRALAVPVNNVSGVGGHILPGDRVDAVATVEVPEGEGQTVLTALIAENLKVLAVGPVVQTREEAQLVADNITLQVPLNKVAELAQAQERGVLQLALRPAGEGGTATTKHHLLKNFLP
ncbi:MAG: Flp pilus assembly protein CpaB [Firmicutes bacterium]|nr:Flp pilus assembly protein CpaB [Bacillota bacterium]